MERDNPVNDDIVFDGNFNSHAHVERDYNPIENYSMTENFNSHAHVERDARINENRIRIAVISTHTLTWSVTAEMICTPQACEFQLTRSRGA